MREGTKRLIIFIIGILFVAFGALYGLSGFFISIGIYFALIYCIRWIINGYKEDNN